MKRFEVNLKCPSGGSSAPPPPLSHLFNFFKQHRAPLTKGVLLRSVARLLVSRSVDGGPIVFLLFKLL